MPELKWGQTPWDNLSREELLREVQRLWSALESTSSCLRIMRASQSGGGYWSPDGSGGRALEKARQIQEPIKEQYDDEQVYRAFFRYADDLLFEGVGSDWQVCDSCGEMTGAIAGMASSVECWRCKTPKRPLTWADLEPRP